ncbi:programmed cell death protein 2-like [Sergentomyia squamirostris]
MAVNRPIVYLGYVDECVTDKHASALDFTTNKIGGNPDWPIPGITVPNCPVCGLSRPLILQIYAPLEGSQFHRTLYIFSCVNSCLQWLCVRSQVLEKAHEKESTRKPPHSESNTVNVNWCSGADDWGPPLPTEDIKRADVENCNEENGNTINKLDKMSDEDDESNSTEVDLLNIIENVHIDERNANSAAQEGGAAGANSPPRASAEIETDEAEVIIIDTPEAPQRDLIALFKQNNVLSSEMVNLTLRSFFISVDEEARPACESSDHIRDLIHEYQKKDEDIKKSPEGASGGGEKRGEILGDGEQYEKGVPAHGDLMFHAFITRIQENPGQILRYSRNTVPLLISYLKESIPKCGYCGSDLICEVQILPTIIPHLQLENCDPAPIEFGNVLIYTCSKNCWDTPEKMRIETVIVQQET